MRTKLLKTVVASLVVVSFGLAVAAQAPVTTETVPGVLNFARVETTVACAGATQPEAMAHIRKQGFVSVITLRLATEAGVDIDAEAAAAKAAGLNFVHLPLNGTTPDPLVVDKFLKVLEEPGTQPAFIHCATGNRAAMMWMIKRVLADKWTVERASDEAAALGLKSSALKQFALDYIETHKR